MFNLYTPKHNLCTLNCKHFFPSIGISIIFIGISAEELQREWDTFFPDYTFFIFMYSALYLIYIYMTLLLSNIFVS